MVLWVITILSVVVLEFSYAMRTEVNITKNFQEELQLYATAEGGIQRTIVELIYKHDPRIQQMRRTWKAEEIPPEQREWITDGREYRLPFAKGECSVRVMGEAGKINLNFVSERMLRRVLTNMGMEEESKEIVVDSILDWRDPDDFYRVNGAENDYYQSLPDPYECKNGNFDSLEELLLVRGVTSDLFYGKRANPGEGEKEQLERPVGLKDVFSLYARGEQIDINSASLPVLRVVLGIPLAICEQIIAAREEKLFENQQDLLLRVPELVPFMTDLGRLILYRAMVPFYTVEARAKGTGGALRGIKVVVKVDPREPNGYKIIQWLDFIT
jgi:general secretion pathway protein K